MKSTPKKTKILSLLANTINNLKKLAFSSVCQGHDNANMEFFCIIHNILLCKICIKEHVKNSNCDFQHLKYMKENFKEKIKKILEFISYQSPIRVRKISNFTVKLMLFLKNLNYIFSKKQEISLEKFRIENLNFQYNCSYSQQENSLTEIYAAQNHTEAQTNVLAEEKQDFVGNSIINLKHELNNLKKEFSYELKKSRSARGKRLKKKPRTISRKQASINRKYDIIQNFLKFDNNFNEASDSNTSYQQKSLCSDDSINNKSCSQICSHDCSSSSCFQNENEINKNDRNKISNFINLNHSQNSKKYLNLKKLNYDIKNNKHNKIETNVKENNQEPTETLNKSSAINPKEQYKDFKNETTKNLNTSKSQMTNEATNAMLDQLLEKESKLNRLCLKIISYFLKENFYSKLVQEINRHLLKKNEMWNKKSHEFIDLYVDKQLEQREKDFKADSQKQKSIYFLLDIEIKGSNNKNYSHSRISDENCTDININENVLHFKNKNLKKQNKINNNYNENCKKNKNDILCNLNNELDDDLNTSKNTPDIDDLLLEKLSKEKVDSYYSQHMTKKIFGNYLICEQVADLSDFTIMEKEYIIGDENNTKNKEQNNIIADLNYLNSLNKTHQTNNLNKIVDKNIANNQTISKKASEDLGETKAKTQKTFIKEKKGAIENKVNERKASDKQNSIKATCTQQLVNVPQESLNPSTKANANKNLDNDEINKKLPNQELASNNFICESNERLNNSDSRFINFYDDEESSEVAQKEKSDYINYAASQNIQMRQKIKSLSLILHPDTNVRSDANLTSETNNKLMSIRNTNACYSKNKKIDDDNNNNTMPIAKDNPNLTTFLTVANNFKIQSSITANNKNVEASSSKTGLLPIKSLMEDLKKAEELNKNSTTTNTSLPRQNNFDSFKNKNFNVLANNTNYPMSNNLIDETLDLNIHHPLSEEILHSNPKKLLKYDKQSGALATAAVEILPLKENLDISNMLSALDSRIIETDHIMGGQNHKNDPRLEKAYTYDRNINSIAGNTGLTNFLDNKIAHKNSNENFNINKNQNYIPRKTSENFKSENNNTLIVNDTYIIHIVDDSADQIESEHDENSGARTSEKELINKQYLEKAYLGQREKKYNFLEGKNPDANRIQSNQNNNHEINNNNNSLNLAETNNNLICINSSNLNNNIINNLNPSTDKPTQKEEKKPNNNALSSFLINAKKIIENAKSEYIKKEEIVEQQMQLTADEKSNSIAEKTRENLKNFIDNVNSNSNHANNSLNNKPSFRENNENMIPSIKNENENSDPILNELQLFCLRNNLAPTKNNSNQNNTNSNTQNHALTTLNSGNNFNINNTSNSNNIPQPQNYIFNPQALNNNNNNNKNTGSASILGPGNNLNSFNDMNNYTNSNQNINNSFAINSNVNNNNNNVSFLNMENLNTNLSQSNINNIMNNLPINNNILNTQNLSNSNNAISGNVPSMDQNTMQSIQLIQALLNNNKNINLALNLQNQNNQNLNMQNISALQYQLLKENINHANNSIFRQNYFNMFQNKNLLNNPNFATQIPNGNVPSINKSPINPLLMGFGPAANPILSNNSNVPIPLNPNMFNNNNSSNNTNNNNGANIQNLLMKVVELLNNTNQRTDFIPSANTSSYTNLLSQNNPINSNIPINTAMNFNNSNLNNNNNNIPSNPINTGNLSQTFPSIPNVINPLVPIPICNINNVNNINHMQNKSNEGLSVNELINQLRINFENSNKNHDKVNLNCNEQKDPLLSYNFRDKEKEKEISLENNHDENISKVSKIKITSLLSNEKNKK